VLYALQYSVVYMYYYVDCLFLPSSTIPSQPTALPNDSSTLPTLAPPTPSPVLAALISLTALSFSSTPDFLHSSLPDTLPMVSFHQSTSKWGRTFAAPAAYFAWLARREGSAEFPDILNFVTIGSYSSSSVSGGWRCLVVWWWWG
jgi:hypothetical protein